MNKFGNWILKFGFSLFLVTCILFLAALPALAFKITPELKTEIKEKQAILENNYSNPFAHFDLAITFGYSNYIVEGWEKLKEIHENYPDFAPLALDRYRAEVRFAPKDWKMRYRLAFTLYFNGKKEAAVQEFKQILKLNPNEVFSYGYLSLIYGEMEEIDEAIKYVKQGIAIDSNVAALHLLLSTAYYKKGASWKGFLEGAEAVRLKALGY